MYCQVFNKVPLIFIRQQKQAQALAQASGLCLVQADLVEFMGGSNT